MKPLLEIKELYVQFGIFEGKLKVLNGVNLVINEGEKVGLVGETGCGKTTTVKSVLQVLPMPPGEITNGEILYGGKDILKMSSKEIRNLRRGQISAIFQDPLAALNPVFTVGHQLKEVIRKSSTDQGKKHLSKKAVRNKAIAVLEETGLPDAERLLTNYPVQLSGGMRQRICISEALSSAGRLLLADEPTTNLDVTIQAQILRRLDKLVEEKGTSVLLISHSLGVVRTVTERLYIMYAGNIVEMAHTKPLLTNPLHPYTKELLKTVPKLTGESMSDGIPGRIPDYLDPPSGCRFHPRCEHSMKKCKEKKPPLFNVGNTHQVACYLYKE